MEAKGRAASTSPCACILPTREGLGASVSQRSHNFDRAANSPGVGGAFLPHMRVRGQDPRRGIQEPGDCIAGTTPANVLFFLEGRERANHQTMCLLALEDYIMRTKLGSSVLVLAFLLSACGSTTGDRAGSGAAIGAATGAVGGALLGAPLAGAAIGAAAGAGVGAATSPAQVDLGPPVWK
jgi:osmotically inducible lipoprotein OsmB